MTTEKEKPRYNAGRRIRWLGAAILVVAVAYTAAWYWLASRVEAGAVQMVDTYLEQGTAIDCADRDVRGYPFRLGVFCSSLDLERPTDGLIVKAGAFRSAAQIYEPSRFYAELDAPVTVESPLTGRLQAGWTPARATATLAEPLPERGSLAVDDLKVAMFGLDDVVTAAHAEVHMRSVGEDLDLALRYEGLVLDERFLDGRRTPALSGDADISLENGVVLAAEGVSSLRGVSGEIRRLALLWTPDRGLVASGPFTVGPDGLIDASLDLIVVDPAGFASDMKPVFPEYSNEIGMIAAGQKEAGPDGTPEIKLPLAVRDGRIMLGFIPIGRIPAVD